MNNTIIKKITNLKETRIYLILVLIFFIFQIIFWTKTEKIKPPLHIVPEPSTQSNLKAIALGDEEFIFRYKGFLIQITGDTFGRYTPLKDYDYKKLTEWFYLLDTLNSKSNYIPSMAASYFSATQNKKDTIYLINYLEDHADKDPKEKWWWYYQAMHIADKIYGDKDLAIKLARKLRENSPINAPLWTKQMEFFLLSDKGDKCQALKIGIDIVNDYQNNENSIIDIQKLNYMEIFIKKQLEEIDPSTCF